MSNLAAYLGVLVVFGAIDATWLTTMGAVLYRPALGDILAADLRVGPAIAFYLMYPIGVVMLAVLPGLRADSIISAVVHGALLGVIAYATYDLTNYATLRNWTLQITVVDIAYGAIASGVAAAAGYGLVRAVAAWHGGAVS